MSLLSKKKTPKSHVTEPYLLAPTVQFRLTIFHAIFIRFITITAIKWMHLTITKVAPNQLNLKTLYAIQQRRSKLMYTAKKTYPMRSVVDVVVVLVVVVVVSIVQMSMNPKTMYNAMVN